MGTDTADDLPVAAWPGDDPWREDRGRTALAVAASVCAVLQVAVGLDRSPFFVVIASGAGLGGLCWLKGDGCLRAVGQWAALLAFAMVVVATHIIGPRGSALNAGALPSIGGLAVVATGVALHAWRRGVPAIGAFALTVVVPLVALGLGLVLYVFLIFLPCVLGAPCGH